MTKSEARAVLQEAHAMLADAKNRRDLAAKAKFLFNNTPEQVHLRISEMVDAMTTMMDLEEYK